MKDSVVKKNNLISLMAFTSTAGCRTLNWKTPSAIKSREDLQTHLFVDTFSLGKQKGNLARQLDRWGLLSKSSVPSRVLEKNRYLYVGARSDQSALVEEKEAAAAGRV